MSEVKSIAHPNFALIKYWGKADSESNTPAMSSISITIDTLSSTTKISKNAKSRDNIWILNDRKQDNLEQVLPTLDYLNKISKLKELDGFLAISESARCEAIKY